MERVGSTGEGACGGREVREREPGEEEGERRGAGRWARGFAGDSAQCAREVCGPRAAGATARARRALNARQRLTSHARDVTESCPRDVQIPNK